MEHSLPPIDSPWRTATLVTAAVALLELVLLIVLAVALLAEPVSQHVRKAAEAKAFAPVVAKPKKPAVPTQLKLTRAETSVIVLNGNGRSGAAAEGADRVRAHGYTIGAVGNAPRGDVLRTVVMYRKGYRPEAMRLARDLKVKIVGPLDGLAPKDMLGAHVALVLGG